MSTWNHKICERCWFNDPERADRFPTQIKRETDDRDRDQCCFCGGWKITRISVRFHPKDDRLKCGGSHPDDDD